MRTVPTIRAEMAAHGSRVVRVLLQRDGHDDVDLTDLFLIRGIRRDIVMGELAEVELRVLGRLVEAEA